MSQHSAARMAWSLCIICAVCSGLAIVFSALNPYNSAVDLKMIEGILDLALPYPILGALVVSKQPRSAIGWIFCTVGLLQGVNYFSGQYGRYALLVGPDTFPGGRAMIWLESWTWIPSLALLVTFLLLLFPNGRLPGPRWRWVAWLAAVGIVLATGLGAIALWPERGLPGLCQQREVENAREVLERICPPGSAVQEEEPILPFVAGGFILTGVSGLLSVAALAVRFRRSYAVERQQLKWFVSAGTLALLGIASSFTPFDAASNILMPLGVTTVPIAVGIAILRYRLYDIDIIIRRTLVYSTLTLILGLVYVGFIVLFQQLVVPLVGGSELAIVASTLAIAALFLPLRRRIQTIIDRRFYRRKYDAARVLAAFGVAARDETDLEQLTAEMLRVVDDTVQPEFVGLWLREPERGG
jgi:hypothetical protein